jgi:prepilin-type N-terminal cleavage/methylation domain-containing protein
MKDPQMQNRTGFTATEMLVVLSIIGVMSGITAPAAISAMRQGQVNAGANAILEIHHRAGVLARQNTDPGKTYGVRIERSGAQTLVSVTARSAGGAQVLSGPGGQPVAQHALGPNAVPFVDQPGTPIGVLAWEIASGSGRVLSPGSTQEMAIGVASSATLAETFGVSDPSGQRVVGITIFPMGVGHVQAD